jgi:O-antigen/teichoic acid export membrane protein
VFISIRFALDQVVAPLAAEARGNRVQLLRLLTTMMRWSSMLAIPVALLIFVGPEQLMRWFGGTGQAVPVLLVLASGRALEMMAAPAASMLAIVGAPKLSLLDATLGIAIALLGQIAVAATGLGPVAIAVASVAGMVVSSVAAVMWLSRRYGLAI